MSAPFGGDLYSENRDPSRHDDPEEEEDDMDGEDGEGGGDDDDLEHDDEEDDGDEPGIMDYDDDHNEEVSPRNDHDDDETESDEEEGHIDESGAYNRGGTDGDRGPSGDEESRGSNERDEDDEEEEEGPLEHDSNHTDELEGDENEDIEENEEDMPDRRGADDMSEEEEEENEEDDGIVPRDDGDHESEMVQQDGGDAGAKNQEPPSDSNADEDDIDDRQAPHGDGEHDDDYPQEDQQQLKAAASGDAMDEDEDEEDEDDEDREETEAATAASESAGAAALSRLQQQQEASYSTRGKAGDHMDPLERLAREALGESTVAPKDKDRESFLNDAITEEERRTRTRYIPAVDGMHALRKHEIKSDLAMARALSGGATAAKPKARRGNSMDVDVEEATSVDEDRSEMGRTTTKVIEIGSAGVVIPSPAFVSPPAPSDDRQAPTPREVDEATAFNPPRPPESVGPKKKHRMLRWERRPADIEVDLSNYRKTVHRTRDELRRALDERDRLVTIDNHLSRHFLHHLDAMSKEWKRLNEELAVVQQECVNSADLLTSRTRSRGAGKSSYAMRDVLAVLRARGQEIEARGLTIPPNATVGDSALSGLGGVNCVSFQDWHRDTPIVPTAIASCWLVPGDSVGTPYGDGVVVAVFGADSVEVTAPPHPDLTFSGRPKASDAMEIDGSPEERGAKTDAKDDAGVAAIATRQALVAPRVAIRLPFGVGYFSAAVLTSKEDPTTYSDARLALRWKGILETGLALGSFLDVAAMSEPGNVYRDDMNSEEDGPKDIDSGEDRVRLLPFGSRMLPTCNGRGAALFNMTPEVLDEEIDSTMQQGFTVLGSEDNPGVPNEIRKIEDENQEEIHLRARALQLRNELYRQRRVRMLNERTYASTQERAGRVESLVAEMRTDLKTLKRRLDEEVAELWITESEAEGILSAYYRSLDSQLTGVASPPKRARRQSHLESDNDAMEEDVEQAEALSTDAALSQ